MALSIRIPLAPLDMISNKRFADPKTMESIEQEPRMFVDEPQIENDHNFTETVTKGASQSSLVLTEDREWANKGRDIPLNDFPHDQTKKEEVEKRTNTVSVSKGETDPLDVSDMEPTDEALKIVDDSFLRTENSGPENLAALWSDTDLDSNDDVEGDPDYDFNFDDESNDEDDDESNDSEESDDTNGEWIFSTIAFAFAAVAMVIVIMSYPFTNRSNWLLLFRVVSEVTSVVVLMAHAFIWFQMALRYVLEENILQVAYENVEELFRRHLLI